MIVITALNTHTPRVVRPGDTFQLRVSDYLSKKEEIVISEEITKEKLIDFMCGFRFAMEDGTCMGFHLCGFFGNSEELPEEIQKAVMFEDLSEIQKRNFQRSVGIRIGDEYEPQEESNFGKKVRNLFRGPK